MKSLLEEVNWTSQWSTKLNPLFYGGLAGVLGLTLFWTKNYFLFTLLLILFCGLLFFKTDKQKFFIIPLLCFVFFFFYEQWNLASPQSAQSLPLFSTIILEGTIQDFPRFRGSKKPRWEFILKTNQTNQKILVYISTSDSSLDLKSGSKISLQGILQKPFTPKNPGEFDYAHYLEKKDIPFIFKAEKDSIHFIEEPNPSLMSLAGDIRKYMEKTLTIGLENKPEAVALNSALLFGNQEKISNSLKDAFRHTGTMHLFAVSGQNIAVLCGFLLLLLGLFGCVRWHWAYFLITPIFLFCLTTGMPSSASRAFTMMCFLFVGWKCMKPIRPLNLVGASALILLLIEPKTLLDIGFQLSFVVVIGLITMTDLSTHFFHRPVAIDSWIPPSKVSKIRRMINKWSFKGFGFFSVSLIAWLCSMPIILYYFHLLSPITVFANICIVPLASIVLILNTLSVGLGWIYSGIAGVINLLSSFILKGIIYLVILFAGWSGSSFYWNPFVQKSNDPQMVIFYEKQGRLPVFIHTPNQNILIQSGNESFWKYTLSHYLQEQGINQLDEAWIPYKSRAIEKGLSNILSDISIKEINRNHLPYKILQLNHHKILWAGKVNTEKEQEIINSEENVQAEILIQADPRDDFLSLDWIKAVSPKTIIIQSLYRSKINSLTLNYCQENNIRIIDLQKVGGTTLTFFADQISIDSKNKENESDDNENGN
jgi:ComEC/Rec2-related protein